MTPDARLEFLADTVRSSADRLDALARSACARTRPALRAEAKALRAGLVEVGEPTS
jgi:hypothetical protein